VLLCQRSQSRRYLFYWMSCSDQLIWHWLLLADSIILLTYALFFTVGGLVKACLNYINITDSEKQNWQFCTFRGDEVKPAGGGSSLCCVLRVAAGRSTKANGGQEERNRKSSLCTLAHLTTKSCLVLRQFVC